MLSVDSSLQVTPVVRWIIRNLFLFLAMRLFLLSLYLLFAVSTNAQLLKGTHVIIAPCKDGLLIGSDSRSAFHATQPDENSIPFAYFDGKQKIFPIKDFAFVVSNLSSVSDTSLHYYFSQFQKSLPDSGVLLERWNAWWRFIRSRPDFNQFQMVQIIAARFENGKPLTMAYFGDYKLDTSTVKYIESDYSSGFKEAFSYSHSWRQMVPAMEQSIKRMAQKKKYSVGGDVAILLITPENKMVWVKPPPKQTQYTTVQDIWRAYKKGKQKISFTKEEYKTQMDSVLKTLQ